MSEDIMMFFEIAELISHESAKVKDPEIRRECFEIAQKLTALGFEANVRGVNDPDNADLDDIVDDDNASSVYSSYMDEKPKETEDVGSSSADEESKAANLPDDPFGGDDDDFVDGGSDEVGFEGYLNSGKDETPNVEVKTASPEESEMGSETSASTVAETPVMETPKEDSSSGMAGMFDIFNEAKAEPDTSSRLPEERSKTLNSFQYDQVALTVNSADGQRHDEVIVTAYPLTTDDSSNTPIFVVLAIPNAKPVFACSYNRETGNMIKTSIGGNDFLITGSIENGKFTVNVMLTGETQQRGDRMHIVKHGGQNPSADIIGCGHIRFYYDAGQGVTGQLEVFPFGANFVYIHKVENFCDMRMYGNGDVAIQTADGHMTQIAIKRTDREKGVVDGNSTVSAELVPYEN
jgi:hypothetical protein